MQKASEKLGLSQIASLHAKSASSYLLRSLRIIPLLQKAFESLGLSRIDHYMLKVPHHIFKISQYNTFIAKGF